MKPFPILLVYVLLSLAVLGLGFCSLMLHRNRLVYGWRTKANHSWVVKAELVSDLLQHNTLMWAHFPEDFYWILQQSKRFCEINHEVPDYLSMMHNFRMWNYEQATGNYENLLEMNFQVILDRIHEVEDKYELLEQRQA